MRRRLAELARRDSLTGLLNRSAILEQFETTIGHEPRTGEGTAVAFFDVDDLKMVNDRSGHRAGDAVLNAVATRVREVVRAGDLVARIGGDE